MENSSYYKNRKIRYINCLNRVIATANNLQMAISLLESMIDVQKKAYRVDEANGDGNYLSHLLEKERKIYSNIVNNIIPGTKSIIQNLDYQIMDAEAREALESQV